MTLEGQYGTGALGRQYQLGGALEVDGYVMVASYGVDQDRVLPLVFTDGDSGCVAGLDGCSLLPRGHPSRPFGFLVLDVDGHFGGGKCVCVTANYA